MVIRRSRSLSAGNRRRPSGSQPSCFPSGAAGTPGSVPVATVHVTCKAGNGEQERPRPAAGAPARPRRLGPARQGRVAAAGTGERRSAAPAGRAGDRRPRRRSPRQDDHAGAELARLRGPLRGGLRLLGAPARPLPGQRLPPTRLGRHGLPPRPLRDPLDRAARAPAGGAPAGRGAERDRARHGAHRLRQDDHVGGDDRPRQQDTRVPHRHHRGPDRGPAPRRAGGDQPARGRLRHRELRRRAPLGASRGPGHHLYRRDARRRDRRDGTHRGRDGSPGAVDVAHDRLSGDRQPHHRLLPRRPAAPGAASPSPARCVARSASGSSRPPTGPAACRRSR